MSNCTRDPVTFGPTGSQQNLSYIALSQRRRFFQGKGSREGTVSLRSTIRTDREGSAGIPPGCVSLLVP